MDNCYNHGKIFGIMKGTGVMENKKINNNIESPFAVDVLTERETEIINAIINQGDWEDYKLEEFVPSFCKVIKNYSFLENSSTIYKGIKYVLENDVDSLKMYEYLLSIRDYLNNRRKHSGKEEKEERGQISRALKYLDMYLPVMEVTTMSKEDILNGQVVEFLLEHEVPYYYIESLFTALPSLMEYKIQDESLIVSVFKHYIESQKEELRNHKKYYISKDYYRDFFRFLYFTPSHNIVNEDRALIDEIKDEFVDYLEEHKYQEDRKVKALNDLDQLFSKKQVTSTITDEYIPYIEALKDHNKYLDYYPRVNMTSDYLDSIRKRIDDYRNFFFQEYDCYPSDETCLDELGISNADFGNAYAATKSWNSFSNPYTSYAVFTNYDGVSYLRMNVLDLNYYVEDGALLDEEFSKNPLYDFGKALKSGAIDKIPSVTYQIKVFPNGKIGKLKVYKSVVPVIREKKDFASYRDDEDLKDLIAIYRKLSKDGRGQLRPYQVEEFFNEVLEELIYGQADQMSLPLISKGVESNKVRDVLKLQDGLGNTFSKMSAKQFKIYSALLDESFDRSHYAKFTEQDGDFSLLLMHPSNYIDLFNQRVLLDMEKIGNDPTKKDLLEFYQDKSEGLLDRANLELDYIGDYSSSKKVKKLK